MVHYQDAFISYGRADSKSFAIQLNERLIAEGFQIWFDFDDIPVGVDFQNQINDGIEESHNFLFVISPHAVNSPYCLKELELALQLNKRIIPLMHVEEVSRDTWQQRHPNGSDADWDHYRQQGLHTSYQNMHPVIGKINWVMFREGIDDFEAWFAKLLGFMKRHQSYVEQHTELLNKALHWQRNQRRSPLLLPQAEGQAAQDWLNTRFDEEQPPCIPTDLHCEYIGESLKYLSQGMSQVFLSYSEDDEVIKREIQRQLRREGITIWSNDTDIRTGEDFQEGINRGIERADNIVFLMSRQSLKSPFCQQELRHAQLYNKRIIPMLVESLDLEALPVDLKTLQFVDCTNYTNPETFEADVARDVAMLVRVLRDQADYFAQHKRLLVKALEWEQADRQKTLLLKGNLFVEAENWLAIANQTRIQPTPLRLHETFISESKEMNRYFDAFISYGRADSLGFAFRLEEQLRQQGLDIWFDKNDIPLGVDYQQQIDDGITKSHNFVFIIAPHAVNSPYCLKEVELALKLNKRVIPLLHIERISRDTWHQRNPHGTDADWHAYQQQGLHSSFINMHPVISKINWVYFREDSDDFEASLRGLIDLVHRHENYVQQHTDLLTQALDWERHQRRTEYLLVGGDRTEAESWLKKRFEDEQPPCTPTDIHSEYICESIKNANNLMTHVFISHAEVDHLEREKIRFLLMREGITVWINRTDIKTGTEFQEEINAGIEEADNIVWMISPASLKSDYCRQELEYAKYLNKRIVPLLIQPIEMDDVPSGLRNLQFIDFTRYVGATGDSAAASKLLNVLAEDAGYHNQHKLLLAKAVKWKQQKKNPSILMRGHELRHFQNWFRAAKNNPQYSPIPLQEVFLQTSAELPPNATVNVFLAYSRADADFARKLNETLQIQGMTTWFDQENIDSGVDFQQEIFNGIENAENFLFIISPSAVTSPFCREEVDYAQKLNKRIVTVLHREVSSALLHPALATVQWIDFRQHGGDFLTNFGQLTRTLASEPDHVKTHTRLLVRSREWDDANRDDSLLLRGKDLQRSLRWLDQAYDKDPQPIELQRIYIEASEDLPRRRIKRRWVLANGALVGFAVACARFLGLTQGVELAAYDHLLRMRAGEPLDEHVTIISVDAESNRYVRDRIISGEYEPGIGTLPDEVLAQALTTLNQYNPRLIGIDFYRDFPAQPELASLFETQDNIITVCKSSALDEQGDVVEGNSPAPEVSPGQVGFSDFADDGGKYIRRHYLMQSPDQEYCPTTDSFNLVLARTYLEQDNHTYYSPLENGEYRYPMQFDDTVVPWLNGTGGAYQAIDNQLEGYHSMLKFRVYEGSIERFAPVIPLREVLAGNVSEEVIRDRLVLIGYTDRADTNADLWDTPYGETFGIFLQGQKASQIVSAVQDGRPLLWWWNVFIELFWIMAWSTLAGLIFWWFHSPRSLILANLGAVAALYSICWITLTQFSGWIPLVPPLLAMVITGLIVAALNYRLRSGSASLSDAAADLVAQLKSRFDSEQSSDLSPDAEQSL
ncbi:MAG: TIR domain-containing protein [Elainellaceae cyanobacterium]